MENVTRVENGTGHILADLHLSPVKGQKQLDIFTSMIDHSDNYIILWVQNGVALLCWVSCLLFYCLFVFRWRLDSVLHWVLCNWAIGQVLRATAVAATNFINMDKISFIITLQQRNASIRQIFEGLKESQPDRRTALQIVAVVSNTCYLSCVALLLFAMQMLYLQLKVPAYRPYRFGRWSGGIIVVVWFSILLKSIGEQYYVEQSMGTTDTFSIVFMLFRYCDMFVKALCLLSCTVLLVRTVQLYLGRVESVVDWEEASRSLCSPSEDRARRWRGTVRWTAVILTLIMLHILFEVASILILIIHMHGHLSSLFDQFLNLEEYYKLVEVSYALLVATFVPFFWLYADKKIGDEACQFKEICGCSMKNNYACSTVTKPPILAPEEE